MVLNEKQRKKYRWLLSEDGIAKLTFAKGLLPIIGGQIFLKLLPSSLDDITGIQKPVCFIIGLLAFLLVIFGIGLILYAVSILPLLFKLDGIWWATIVAELFAFLLSIGFVAAKKKKYGY